MPKPSAEVSDEDFDGAPAKRPRLEAPTGGSSLGEEDIFQYLPISDDFYGGFKKTTQKAPFERRWLVFMHFIMLVCCFFGWNFVGTYLTTQGNFGILLATQLFQNDAFWICL